jgi:hypothetical protein
MKALFSHLRNIVGGLGGKINNSDFCFFQYLLARFFAHRNLKSGSRAKTRQVKKYWVKKCESYERPKTMHTCIEHCAMENCGGKIQFMI